MSKIRPYDPAPAMVEALSVEDTVARLLISLASAFLISFVYRLQISKLPSFMQHIFNTVIGFSLMYYCFGTGILHLLFDIIITLVILKTTGGTFSSVVATWAIVFGHLLYGYYKIVTSDNVGRLDWTVGGCIISLKLAGLASDLYDTVQTRRGESAPMRIGILEVFGYSSISCSSIVGPAISYQTYVDFVNGDLYDAEKTPSSIPYGILRFLIGISFLGIYAYFLPYVPLDYFASAEFAAKPFYYKFFLAAVRYKVQFKQYSAIWLLSEGACVVTGISYKGRKKDGTADWSGCAGIHVIQLDTALNTQSVISAFNLTTNDWVLRHVYKKCRFLNSKIASQTISVMFLATWHGLLPGYYLCFLHEIFIVMVEKQIMDYGTAKLGPLSSWPIVVRIVSIPVFYLYQIAAITMPLTLFQLLTFERCMAFFKAMNRYTLYAYIFLVPLGKYLEIQLAKKEKRRKELLEKKQE